jgi:hypothetical protein
MMMAKLFISFLLFYLFRVCFFPLSFLLSVDDFVPAAIPEMPRPVPEGNNMVRIGGKLYTPTHPLSALGLLGIPLPQQL